MTANTDVDGSREKMLALLEKVQALIDVEKALTASIEKVEPWLVHQTTITTTMSVVDQPRVRPIPTTLVEAVNVLSVARNWASRTSAPAGWTPNAPVVGFSTPNPMPHQLRGGALATLQLERAKQAETTKKRQKMEERKAAAAVASITMEQQQGDVVDPADPGATLDQHPRSAKTIVHVQQEPSRPERPIRPKQEVSMNLSESSSSEAEDDDDDMDEA